MERVQKHLRGGALRDQEILHDEVKDMADSYGDWPRLWPYAILTIVFASWLLYHFLAPADRRGWTGAGLGQDVRGWVGRRAVAPAGTSFRLARRFVGGAIINLSLVAPAVATEPVLLADPTRPLAQAWTHRRFVGETAYDSVTLDGMAAIRAVGRRSASGLYRDVSYRTAEHPWLEWTWRVDRLQRTADIREKGREDFAAAIFLIFGRPSVLKRDVPTLAYVWTSDRLAQGAIADSAHHPGVVQHVAVRAGPDGLGQWLRERRNVVDDFRRAFGRDPPDAVEVIALFTDNDETGEPVEAYYGAIQATSE